MSDVIDRLWDEFGRLTIDDVPADVVEIAHHSVIDWFGCAVAGSAEPLSGILCAATGTDRGGATLVGLGRSTSERTAAMVNGTAGHALDFDDTSIVMGGHPTVPVLPAVLALGETVGATGADVLAAYLVGHEVEARIADMLGNGHYVRGWHSTSTVGIFGAAAGCARLLRLDRHQFKNAIGVAASNSAGVKANFGTMTKPLHAGQAAERGLLAARLAANGFTAAPDAFDGPQGLAVAAGSPARWDRLARQTGAWLTRQTLFKYHAACYLTHAAIEATAAVLRPSEPFDQAEVTVHPSLLDVCNITAPTSGLEAKFSLSATLAYVALGIDTADPRSFTDDVVNRPDVQSLLAAVTVRPSSRLRNTQAEIALRTPRGELSGFYDTGVPASDLAKQRERLTSKSQVLATPVVGAANAARLVSEAGRLSSLVDLSFIESATRPVVSGPGGHAVDDHGL
jgi:2-methylcitrate dehydratase PrpD